MNCAALIEMAVIKLSPYIDIERPLMWLSEKGVDRPRLLPIGIRDFEAVAIQMVLEGDNPPRPLPQDLLFSMLGGLSVSLRNIVLQLDSNQLFTAQLTLEVEGQTKQIDARPSDAVALALRAQAAIFAKPELLEQAAFSSMDEENVDQAIERFGTHESQILPSPDPVGPGLLADPHLEGLYSEPGSERLGELRHQLEKAVLCEEYEEAARLRDEIFSLVAKSKP